MLSLFFFFNDTATTEIYTLSLHDALPISDAAYSNIQSGVRCAETTRTSCGTPSSVSRSAAGCMTLRRSEEHTSELQSQSNLVCRLLLEKKKTNSTKYSTNR